MGIDVYIAVELAVIIIALGFILLNDSAQLPSKVVAVALILVGICFVTYLLGKNADKFFQPLSESPGMTLPK